jgi:hypothetical protein
MLAQIISVFALAFSAFSYGLARRAFQLSKESAVNSRRPVLAFVLEQGGWVVKNVGNGPALNIIAAEAGPDLKWQYPVRLPPLGKDEPFPLTWPVAQHLFALTYEDFAGIKYWSRCIDTLSSTGKGVKVEGWPRWKNSEITPYWKASKQR